MGSREIGCATVDDVGQGALRNMPHHLHIPDHQGVDQPRGVLGEGIHDPEEDFLWSFLMILGEPPLGIQLIDGPPGRIHLHQEGDLVMEIGQGLRVNAGRCSPPSHPSDCGLEFGGQGVGVRSGAHLACGGPRRKAEEEAG